MSLLDSNPTVGKTAGAFYLGVIFATASWGAGCVQLHYYFSRYNDDWPVRNLVILVAMFVTIHQGLIVHTSYTYLVTEFGNYDYLGVIVKGHNVSMLLCGFVCTMVQCFMIHRTWKLSRGNVPLVFGLGILIVAQRAAGVAYFGVSTQFSRFPDLTRFAWLTRTMNVVEAICDLTIALVLIHQLWLSRTGFRCSDTIIKRLIILTISTGFATSVCSLMALIMSLVYPHSTTYLAFLICNSPLYMNALIATLNTRITSSCNREVNDSNPGSVLLSPLRPLSRSFKGLNSQITVSVITETHSDLITTLGESPVLKKNYNSHLPFEKCMDRSYNTEACIPLQVA